MAKTSQPTPVATPHARLAQRIAQGGTVLCIALLGVRPYLDAAIYPTAHEFLISLAIVMAALTAVAAALGKGTRVPAVATGAMVVWVLWSGASVVWSVDRGASIRAWFELVAMASVWAGAMQLSADPRRRRTAAIVLAFGLVGVCLYGLLQYQVLFPRMRREVFEQMKHAEDWIGNVAMDRLGINRIYATFLSPSMFGAYLALCVPPVLGALCGSLSPVRKKTHWPSALGFSGLLLLTGACLGMSIARGAWLGTLAALIVFAGWGGLRWVRRGRTAALLILAFSFAFAPAKYAQDVANMQDEATAEQDATGPGEEIDFIKGMDPAYWRGYFPTLEQLLSSDTLRQRISYWRGTVGMIHDRPFRGMGIGAWGTVYPNYLVLGGYQTQLAHNNYLQVFAESGPIGLACFLVILGSALWGGARHVRRAPSPQARLIWMGATCGVIAFAVQSLTDYALYAPSVAWMAFALFGALSAAPSGEAEVAAAPHPVKAGIAGVIGVGALLAWQPVAESSALVRLARAQRDGEQLLGARRTAVQAMERAPWSGEAAALAGTLLMQGPAGRDFEASRAAFDRAIALSPRSPWVRESYANVLWDGAVRRGDQDLAAEALRQTEAAVERFPTHPDLRATLAERLAALGMTDRAQQEAANAEALRAHYHAPTERG